LFYGWCYCLSGRYSATGECLSDKVECASNQYEMYNMCFDCSPNCAGCTDWLRCNTCDSGFVLTSGFCKQDVTCGPGQFKTQAITCKDCKANCTDCADVTGACNTCAASF
jgi:hypothetical protein